jgi:hypothetical protein
MTEEDEAFNDIERRSKVKQTLIVHKSKEAMLSAEVAVLTEMVRVLSDKLAQMETEQNLNCKSVQARLASSWGYVKAQPEQEPDDLTIAYMVGFSRGKDLAPQRTWVGLTDEERNSLYEAHHNKYDLPNQGSPDGMDYERAIEAKLKEKNTP